MTVAIYIAIGIVLVLGFIILCDIAIVAKARRDRVRERVAFYADYVPPKGADAVKDRKEIAAMINEDADCATLNRRGRKALAAKVQRTMRHRAEAVQ